MHAGEAGLVWGLLEGVYGGLEEITFESLVGMLGSSVISMAALAGGEAVAFASAHSLPGGVLEVRSLAVAPSREDVLYELLARILSEARRLLEYRVARVSALGVPSIIEAVKRLGLRPKRRILKIKWRLRRPRPRRGVLVGYA